MQLPGTLQGAGSALSRALMSGIATVDPTGRRGEAVELAALSCDKPDAHDSAAALAHLMAAVLDGAGPLSAVASTYWEAPIGEQARNAMAAGIGGSPGRFGRLTAPLELLATAVWALQQTRAWEAILGEVTAVSYDPAAAAVAGCFLGARDGDGAVPTALLRSLGCVDATVALAARLEWVRCLSLEPQRRPA